VIRVFVVIAIALGCNAKPKESRTAHDVRIVREENAPEKLFARGQEFHAMGDLTRAEQYYAAAMQQGYPEAKVLPVLLRVCIASSRYRVAIDYAEPVLKKNPTDHRLRLVVGSLYTAIGQPENARKHYEAVVADAPNDATGHFALAVLLRDEFNDRVTADKHFREYLRLDPQGPHVEEAKGSLLKDVTPPMPGPAPATSTSGPTPLIPKPEPPKKIP
jgi:tetratricopeptide (TPR) repeat protein